MSCLSNNQGTKVVIPDMSDKIVHIICIIIKVNLLVTVNSRMTNSGKNEAKLPIEKQET